MLLLIDFELWKSKLPSLMMCYVWFDLGKKSLGRCLKYSFFLLIFFFLLLFLSCSSKKTLRRKKVLKNETKTWILSFLGKNIDRLFLVVLDKTAKCTTPKKFQRFTVGLTNFFCERQKWGRKKMILVCGIVYGTVIWKR